MESLTPTELRERLSAGPVALFDVRGDLDYQRGHIPESMSAPLGSLVFRVASVMNPGSFVVVYSSGDDGLAVDAAERLEGLRMRNVHCLEGGLTAWRETGGAVVAALHPKTDTDGPAVDCRLLVVDRETAYGGVFLHPRVDGEGAGGG